MQGKPAMDRNQVADKDLEQPETLIQNNLGALPEVTQDLREEVRTREDAEEAQSLLSIMAKYSEDALIGKTLDGIITSWNPSAEKMFGYLANEAVGKPITLIFPPDRIGEEQIILRRVQENGIIENYETVRLTKDGKYINVSVTICPIRDLSGNIIGLASLKRNISKRLEIEAALKDYMQRLERSNRELENFAFVASHDLQEPLRKIQTFCDILRSKFEMVLGEKGKYYLFRIINTANRMSILLRALREYSGISSPSIPFRPIDLTQVVHDSISKMSLEIEKAGARIEIGDLPVIEADPDQIGIIVQNLVMNSITFHQEGKRSEIKIYGSVKGDVCELLFQDNGIGFEQRYAELIFRPFQQLNLKGDNEGVGIGLTICRRIVQRHGGTITAKSNTAKGATFIIRLPVGNPEAHNNRTTPSSTGPLAA